MKKVLVLGAGMVARPLVAYLLARPDLEVTVADADGDRAARLVAGAQNGASLALDARDLVAVGGLIDACDLVVSLLPPALEPPVTRVAVERRKDMVSASPRGEAGMDALDAAARAAGVTLLPEVGLDPGLDHMAIARIVARVRARGGRVVACRSYCGGLAAPEANTNCWDYKFSWNPMGAVEASLFDARYLRDGCEVAVPNNELFENHFLVSIPGFDELEAHFNGDSLPYVGIYGLEGIPDLLRATLRYPGWAFTMRQVQKLSYNSMTPMDEMPASYAALTRRLAGVDDGGDLVAGLARFLDVDVQSAVVERLVWLGLTSDAPIVWRAGQEHTPLNALANRMLEKMMFEPGERDLSVLHNEIEAVYPSGERERSTATLIAYGDPGGDSSMALTVGTPAAIAATLVLDGRVPEKGLVMPVLPHIYDPILDELETLGVAFHETTEAIPAKG
jgi:saccharopine dehydrogenase (NADP+, L-glutamate forming)/spermidine synthase